LCNFPKASSYVSPDAKYKSSFSNVEGSYSEDNSPSGIVISTTLLESGVIEVPFILTP